MEVIRKHSPNEEYLIALGTLVHWFSKVEVALGHTLCGIVGMGLDMGQAVFSGVRADSAKNLIIRVLEKQKRKNDIDTLKPVFDQLGLLISVRNDLLHHGIRQEPDEDFSVLKRSYVREKDVKYPLSIADINSISKDLFKIQAHLIHFQWYGVAPDGPMFRDLDRWRSEPWRYKRSGQSVQTSKTKPSGQ